MNTREATQNTNIAGIDLRVLGPFRLEIDGGLLEIGARKNKALVALLALEGPCSREWLAELLWGEFGEFGARKNLRKNLHRLRETALGPHLKVHGETLELQVGRVDALEFKQRMASLEFERALEVCTGTLLEGLEFESDGWMAWLEARRAGVTAHQREAFTGLAAQRETHGDLRGALEVSARALLVDAFDERAVREVMRLHIALGERDGALRVFEHFREQAASMGFEPEVATRALLERARTGTLESNSDVLTDALHAPLVGREEAWLCLSRAGARLNVLVGEPGVGKTRLALEFAGTHGECFVARGREEAARTPFAPIAQLVRDAILSGAWSPTTLEDVWRLEVARLVPECAPDAVPPSTAGDGRSRFLEGLFRTVVLVIKDRTLVLDDLHWFDEGTLELVSHLVRRADGARFVATARALELEASEAARRTLEGLRRDGLSETIQLEPLAEPDVLAMVQGLSGAGGGALFARRLHAVSRGNPLYILELVRGLFEAGAVTRVLGGGWATPYDDSTRDYAELPIPPNLRETVLGRVARLGQRTRRLLEAASLAGERFSGAWLAGIEPDEFARLDALEAACHAGLLEPDPSGFRFRHELLRRALDESQSPERRRVMHNALASQLEATQAAPERIADHLERAGRGENAVPHLERAAENAFRVYAYRESLEYTDRALEHAHDDAGRWTLEQRRVTLLRLMTDVDAYRESLDRLEQLSERLNDPNRRAEAYFARGMFHLYRGQSLEAAAQAARILALPDLGDPMRVNALYVDGHAQIRLGGVTQAVERFSRALELRRKIEDADELEPIVEIENGLTIAHIARGECRQALDVNERVVIALEGTDHLTLVYAFNLRGWIETMLGRFEPAQQAFEHSMMLARARNDANALSFAHCRRATLYLALGESQGAHDDIFEGLRLSAGKNLRLEAIFTGLHAAALRLEGRLGEALRAMQDALGRLRALNMVPVSAEVRLALGGLLVECGDVSAAQIELETVRVLGQTGGDEATLDPYRAALDTLAARIELTLDQPERALERLRATPCLENATFFDRAAHTIELAHAMALTGDAPGALERLQTLEFPPPLEPRALGVQLEAHLMLGEVPENVLERALATLEADHAAPTDRLELMVNVARVLHHLGCDTSAVHVLAHGTLESLAASLEQHPELRVGLLERFGTR